MPIWRGFTVEMFAGVDFIDAGPSGGAQDDVAVTSTYLLAQMQRVRTDNSADASRNLYVFAGVETYADAFTECAFMFRRRLGAAAVFALDTRSEVPDQYAVESEWSLLPPGVTLLTFDTRFKAAGHVPTKVLADPRSGMVSMAARQCARKEMNVSDGDFVLTVVSNDAFVAAAQIARQTVFIRALMQSADSRLLIAGDGDKTVAPWLADLSATFPGRTGFVEACADSPAGIHAADLLLMQGERGFSNGLRCGANARASALTDTTPDPTHEHRIVVLEEDANTDIVDDFVQAVSLLPGHWSRGSGLLRDSLVLSLRARMNSRFGRSLYYAMTTVR